MERPESPAKKIRFLLQTHGMTVQTLADEVALPKQSLLEVVDGHAVPTPNLLHRICAVFTLKENYFGDAIHPRPPRTHAEPAKAANPVKLAKLAKTATTDRDGAPGDVPDMTRPRARGSKRRPRLDLRELAARQQALLDCLVAKKVITLNEYEKRLDTVRLKVESRRNSRTR